MARKLLILRLWTPASASPDVVTPRSKLIVQVIFLAKNQRVVTWTDKQIGFSKDEMESLSVDESDYYMICVTKEVRWYLLTLSNFYANYKNRWDGFTDRERDQLVAEATKGLVCPVGCEEDLKAIDVTLGLINQTLLELSGKLGPVGSNLDLRLVDIGQDIDALTVAVQDGLGEDLFDQLEPILQGVGVILGAPIVPIP